MSDAERAGTCHCGRVRFVVELPTRWCAHCHCHDCRGAHGAAFVTWFGVPRAQFRVVSGEAELVRYASSDAARRSFCRHCGTTMLFEGERWPDEVHVALACMRDPIDREPRANAYWDRHVPWLEGLDALPRRGGPTGTEPLDEG
jgi:hypothetical protein